MKHPIKINGKTYKIKAIDDLTTAEFIELSKIKDLDHVKYISWQAGIKLADAFFAVVSPPVEMALGSVPDISKLPIPKWVDKNKIIDTVGQRHQVEDSNIEGYELLVFCLAVAQARSNNIDDVKELCKKYYQMNFKEVLPAGFFFFMSYKNGKKKGLNFLRTLLILKKIRKQKKRQEFIS